MAVATSVVSITIELTRTVYIKARLKGFNLSIDFEKLDYADKLYAREMLQKAMAKLEPGAED